MSEQIEKSHLEVVRFTIYSNLMEFVLKDSIQITTGKDPRRNKFISWLQLMPDVLLKKYFAKISLKFPPLVLNLLGKKKTFKKNLIQFKMSKLNFN